MFKSAELRREVYAKLREHGFTLIDEGDVEPAVYFGERRIVSGHEFDHILSTYMYIFHDSVFTAEEVAKGCFSYFLWEAGLGVEKA
ncbi:MAG: hypothetical protein QW514_06605 [Thermoprotei archaeon]